MIGPRLAPAKVNLYLHVAQPDVRGYHPLQSLVVFADIGDELALTPKTSDEGLNLYIDGPFGEGLGGGEDNLVIKAVRRFEQATGVKVSADIRLTKSLPVASGIGGGSSDAGAVLHLLRDAYAPNMPDRDLESLAAAVGADGVMCLWARAAIAEGYGERLMPVTAPPMAAVLVNPGIACSTPAVFAAYDALGFLKNIESKQHFVNISSPDSLILALEGTRNDLEAPAIALTPEIADVLRILKAQPEAVFTRMSGSGATCFALCHSDEDAAALSRRLDGLLPGAWIRACRLS